MNNLFIIVLVVAVATFAPAVQGANSTLSLDVRDDCNDNIVNVASSCCTTSSSACCGTPIGSGQNLNCNNFNILKQINALSCPAECSSNNQCFVPVVVPIAGLPPVVGAAFCCDADDVSDDGAMCYTEACGGEVKGGDANGCCSTSNKCHTE